MLAICLRTGQLQLMKDEMDDTCLVLKTGMQASNIKWNSNGSVLAVSGVMGNTGPGGALVQFYSYSGRCLHQLPLQLLHVHSPTHAQLSLTARSSSDTSSYVFTTLACGISECKESKLQLHLQVKSLVVPNLMLYNLCRCIPSMSTS